MSSKSNKIPSDYQDKLKAWKQRLKDEWAYNRKLVVYGDGNGTLITPTSTTSTTTTTTPAPNTVTTRRTFRPVIDINETTVDPRASEVGSKDTTDLLKIIGITCGSLVFLLIVCLIIIRLCRRSSAKRRERISLRRPLNNPEPEEHIYAEIEPFQGQNRSNSPGTSSGTSGGNVPLPSRKERKTLGGFRIMSTRIYRFFNHEHNHSPLESPSRSRDNRDNRHDHVPLGQLEAPSPPDRDMGNGRRPKRGRGVERYESSASQRPLLDSERTSTSSAEMRGNIYNPLLRHEENRESGPYDDLAHRRESNPESETPPSPHDYFTLEGARKTEGASGQSEASNDYFKLETENKHGPIDTIQEEESEPSEAPKAHDYFILEPQPGQTAKPSESDDQINTSENNPTESVNNNNVSPSKSVKSNNGNENLKSPNKVKPQAKPRSSKSRSDSNKSVPSSPVNESINDNVEDKTQEDGVKNDRKSVGDDKDEVYTLSKLGDAPVPPTGSDPDPTEDEYLLPQDKKKVADYVDILPNPPPRTTSMSPEHKVVPQNESPQKVGSPNSSPQKVGLRNSSPQKVGSPNSSTQKVGSQKSSPQKVGPEEKNTSVNGTSPKHKVITPDGNNTSIANVSPKKTTAAKTVSVESTV